MNWKNVASDGPPEDNRTVLISVDGVYYVSVYLQADGSFKVSDDRLNPRFFSEHNIIYWSDEVFVAED